MKQKFIDEIKDIFSQSISWAKLEIDYIKLTAAEKLIILMSALIIGGIIMLLLLPLFIMLLFALVGVFRIFMSPPLAYLSVGGIVFIILLIVFFFRKILVINPVARFITKLIIENHPSKSESNE
ncbi:MAG: phage holin family protein [Muribaculaceae bacterium]|nr:phage holin family protein [Muribaculaceae bacterium]